MLSIMDEDDGGAAIKRWQDDGGDAVHNVNYTDGVDAHHHE